MYKTFFLTIALFFHPGVLLAEEVVDDCSIAAPSAFVVPSKRKTLSDYTSMKAGSVESGSRKFIERFKNDGKEPVIVIQEAGCEDGMSTQISVVVDEKFNLPRDLEKWQQKAKTVFARIQALSQEKGEANLEDLNALVAKLGKQGTKGAKGRSFQVSLKNDYSASRLLFEAYKEKKTTMTFFTSFNAGGI